MKNGGGVPLFSRAFLSRIASALGGKIEKPKARKVPIKPKRKRPTSEMVVPSASGKYYVLKYDRMDDPGYKTRANPKGGRLKSYEGPFDSRAEAQAVRDVAAESGWDEPGYARAEVKQLARRPY